MRYSHINRKGHHMAKSRAHPHPSRYETPTKASEILGVHVQTLRRWAAAGTIDSITTPGGHKRYAIDAYIRRSALKHSKAALTPAPAPEGAEVEAVSAGAGSDAPKSPYVNPDDAK